MSLASGQYSIRSAAFDNLYVGRNPDEDFSLLPKAVISLPSNLTTPTPPVWDIEVSQDPAFFAMKIGGAPTAVIHDQLFAILLDQPPGENWTIQPLPQYGDNQYLILAQNGIIGWVLPDQEPLLQVDVRPLIVAPTFPPRYPDNERWIIDPLALD